MRVRDKRLVSLTFAVRPAALQAHRANTYTQYNSLEHTLVQDPFRTAGRAGRSGAAALPWCGACRSNVTWRGSSFGPSPRCLATGQTALGCQRRHRMGVSDEMMPERRESFRGVPYLAQLDPERGASPDLVPNLHIRASRGQISFLVPRPSPTLLCDKRRASIRESTVSDQMTVPKIEQWTGHCGMILVPLEPKIGRLTCWKAVLSRC